MESGVFDHRRIARGLPRGKDAQPTSPESLAGGVRLPPGTQPRTGERSNSLSLAIHLFTFWWSGNSRRDRFTAIYSSSESTTMNQPRRDRSSRYLRPVVRPDIQLQERDLEVLGVLATYRWCTIEHIHPLAFDGISLRIVQRRLRRLWAAGYIDRIYFSVRLEDGRPVDPRATRPVYALTALGSDILREQRGERSMPPTNKPSTYLALAHHLIVTDVLVALAVSLEKQERLRLIRIEREDEMRRKALAWRNEHASASVSIVPDGAITLEELGKGPVTFYLEIIRASVRGGNKELVAKLNRYARLHYERFFENVYGHRRVRAVLLATTSTDRAENFRVLAASALKHGRGLFWFGAYDRLTAENILREPWRTVDDRVRLILPPQQAGGEAAPTV
jgi:hypothetical protein